MVENPYLQEADRLDIYGSGGALIIATDFASKKLSLHTGILHEKTL